MLPTSNSQTEAPDQSTGLLYFLASRVEPHREKLNAWASPKASGDILREDARLGRNLKVKKLSPPQSIAHYALIRGGTTVGGLDGKYTTLVSYIAKKATEDRQTTFSYLMASGIPTAESAFFDESERDAAEQYVLASESPTSIKPVLRNVRNTTPLVVATSSDFEDAWNETTKAISQLKRVDRRVQAERTPPDVQLRVFVVGEVAVAALALIPLYVVGDGTSTIEQLLEQENQRRQKCEYLKKRRVRIDDRHLAAAGHRRNDILASQRIQTLTPVADPRPALTMDVLEVVSAQLKDLAIDAMWAFPGLSSAAVDIVTPAIDSSSGSRVIDVNPAADLAQFTYPAYGKPRRTGVRIVDRMIAAAK